MVARKSKLPLVSASFNGFLSLVKVQAQLASLQSLKKCVTQLMAISDHGLFLQHGTTGLNYDDLVM